MGTNLSQVFVSNKDGATVQAGTTTQSFNQIENGQVGVWDLGGQAWVNTALYSASLDTQSAITTTDTLTTVANPAWLYNNLQFVQGTAGNPLATPMINVRNIRRISHDPYAASTRANVVTGTLTAAKNFDIKLIIKMVPTAQLNFNDANSTGYVDLSGGGKQFPLGAYNLTNHKVLHTSAYGASETAAGDNLVSNIQENGILNALFTASNSAGAVTITARHAGVQFELIAENVDDDTVLANGSSQAFLPGVGNPWQVLSEEIRCRSRYGDFNRMYLPQNPATYTQADGAYNKIVIEYEHNWPNSTGIAPAGALNQCVIYFDSDGAAVTTSEGDFDAIFGIADLTEAAEFMW